MIVEGDSYFWRHVGYRFDKKTNQVQLKKKRRCLVCREIFTSSGNYICSQHDQGKYDGPILQEKKMLEREKANELSIVKVKNKRAKKRELELML